MFWSLVLLAVEAIFSLQNRAGDQFLKEELYQAFRFPEITHLLLFILTREGLLTVCIDMVLITMPVENIRNKSKARDSSQTCAITLAAFSKKANWTGMELKEWVRQASPAPCIPWAPEPAVTGSTCANSCIFPWAPAVPGLDSGIHPGLPLCSQKQTPHSFLRHANG